MFEILANLFNQILFLIGYVSSNSVFPKPLSPKEEAECVEKIKSGDKNAKNTLIEHNLRLVAHIAKKYAGENNVDDLISIGTIGLIKAVNTFDPEKNPKPSTYMARCIENEVLMHLRSLKKQSAEISLDECIGTDKEGNSMTFSDVLPSDSADVFDVISAKYDAIILKKAMKKVLKKCEYDILCWRYGLFSNDRKTQREISKILGISRSYVSRIEKKAIGKLYSCLKDMNIR